MPRVDQPQWVQIGPCRVICADWTKIVLPLFDALISDPPYGIAHPCNFATRGRGDLAPCRDFEDVVGDVNPFDPSALIALGVPTVLWGANHYASRLPDSGGWLVWDKMRPDDLDQATCELAWTNCVKGVRRFKHLWNGCMKDSQRGEGWHPTEKPVALMEWILSLRWCRDFKMVFDPYMGSGSTGIACLRKGIGFVGVEISPRHFNTACGRLISEWRGLNSSAPRSTTIAVGDEG